MFNKRHALLPIQDQRRVGACHAPYAYKGRVRVPSLPQRTHALATCTRSLVPGLPDLNGHVRVHMVLVRGGHSLV